MSNIIIDYTNLLSDIENFEYFVYKDIEKWTQKRFKDEINDGSFIGKYTMKEIRDMYWDEYFYK